MAANPKPKLVYFQWDHSAIPEFAQLHMRLHVKCLAEFFQVVVVNRDCDYVEVCEQYEPDLALFEAGVNYRGSRRPMIRNTSANAAVPKLGLHNGDAWCEARSGFLSDMERWGISTFFTISTTTAEHTPSIADCTYVWPNFVDADLFRDYGQSKVIPVMISGRIDGLYPWRQRIEELVTRTYPSLTCPHHGYETEGGARTLYGERYARAINASFFVASCGTVAHEFVRKHLEIPGALSCLVTEESPSLKAAGFVSMQNCVFADADDILDKLDHLLRNPAELAAITGAGHELVHSRHAMKQRDQVYQWFRLQSEPGSGKIVQMGPFGPLARSPNEGISAKYILGGGAHLEAMKEGDQKAALGQLDEAERAYRRCSNYSPAMPEPRLKLAWCSLQQGNTLAALSWLQRSIQYTLEIYEATDPDPVEWAVLIITTLCMGDTAKAASQASQFPHLSHPTLDRTRWAVAVLRNDLAAMAALNGRDETAPVRLSVHNILDERFETWVESLCGVFSACGRFVYAEKVRRAASILLRPAPRVRTTRPRTVHASEAAPALSVLPLATLMPSATDPARDAKRIARKVVQQTASWAQDFLNILERRVGYFLPYRYSALKHHPFGRAIQRLVWQEKIQTVLVLGARSGLTGTEAVLVAPFQNSRLIFLSNKSVPGFRALKRRCGSDSGVRFVEALINGQLHGEPMSELGLAPETQEFDLLVIASNDAPASTAMEMSNRARFVVIASTSCDSPFETHQHLLASRRHQLLKQDVTELGGFSFFENLARRPLPRSSIKRNGPHNLGPDASGVSSTSQILELTRGTYG